MPLKLIRADITELAADAVVNAANSQLLAGGGVCGAIFRAAGYDRLTRACDAIGGCPVGGAVITPGFRLKANYIIHAVGPIWRGGNCGEEELLAGAYTNAMALAVEHGCKSIAFPLISSGIYGYPKPQALRVAVDAIRGFLAGHELEVVLTLFDPMETLLGERYHRAADYVERHLFCEYSECAPAAFMEMEEEKKLPLGRSYKSRALDNLMDRLEESFNAMLLRLIDEKGFTDVEVYKRANLDRKHFSKLRREGYLPRKHTAVALAIALRLNLDETWDLLGRVGFALTHASRFDIVVEYCIENGIYDIFEVNELLFAFGEELLG